MALYRQAADFGTNANLAFLNHMNIQTDKKSTFFWRKCFSVKKQRDIRKKSDEKMQKRSFPAFSAGKEFFSQIGLSHDLSIANTHFCVKYQKILMMKSRENAQKPVFPAFSARNEFFFKNRAPSHFGHYHFASLCR